MVTCLTCCVHVEGAKGNCEQSGEEMYQTEIENKQG